jgi:hypothetical protein
MTFSHPWSSTRAAPSDSAPLVDMFPHCTWNVKSAVPLLRCSCETAPLASAARCAGGRRCPRTASSREQIRCTRGSERNLAQTRMCSSAWHKRLCQPSLQHCLIAQPIGVVQLQGGCCMCTCCQQPQRCPTKDTQISGNDTRLQGQVCWA